MEARREVALRRREAEAASGFQLNLQLPEARLIQYDCGKLQVPNSSNFKHIYVHTCKYIFNLLCCEFQILSSLLHKLKSGGHRVLLFTQV